MSAPESTAMTTPAARPSILPPEVLAAIEHRKAQNAVVAQLAALNWGKALDAETRRAVANWGRDNNVDVITEIDLLGGNISPNARFYLRKLGEMIAAGLVEYAVADYIQVDPRLLKIGTPEAHAEDERRAMQRIKHAVPDAAAAACCFRVKLHSLTEEIVGVKWCGGGTRKGDPVGDAFPIESSASRAARRAMRIIASHVPRVQAEMARLETTGAALGVRVLEQTRETVEQAKLASEIGRHQLTSGDPYLDAEREEMARQVPEPVALEDSDAA